MVDEGRKVYSRRNALDAETGRTIPTPEHARAEETLTTRKVVFVSGIAALAVIGIAVSVWAWWVR